MAAICSLLSSLFSLLSAIPPEDAERARPWRLHMRDGFFRRNHDPPLKCSDSSRRSTSIFLLRPREASRDLFWDLWRLRLGTSGGFFSDLFSLGISGGFFADLFSLLSSLFSLLSSLFSLPSFFSLLSLLFALLSCAEPFLYLPAFLLCSLLSSP